MKTKMLAHINELLYNEMRVVEDESNYFVTIHIYIRLYGSHTRFNVL